MTRTKAAGTLLAMAFVVAGAWPAAAQTPTPDEPASARVTATLNRAPAQDYDVNDPLVLRPDRELAVAVEVTNTGDSPLEVRSVRLEGRVLGLTFIDYDTRVDAVGAPGETVDRSFDLDLGRLNEQAVGLLPVELSILDDEREAVAAVPFVVDARGDLTSAYGLFGLLVAVATALLLAGALLHLARGTLPEHRWYRAVRFAVPGAGVGLTVTVTLSVLGVLSPDPGSAVTIVVGCALAGLLLGFLTPHPHYRYEALPIDGYRGIPRHQRDGEAGALRPAPAGGVGSGPAGVDGADAPLAARAPASAPAPAPAPAEPRPTTPPLTAPVEQRPARAER